MTRSFTPPSVALQHLINLAGPSEPYETEQDLLEWLTENFLLYGDIFKASIYGSEVLVASRPEYARHVLCSNWRNYKKGQMIKRVAMLLGNGLMVSEGEFWKAQRQAITPQYHRQVIAALHDAINFCNLDLLGSWTRAADRREAVNVTRDVSVTVLKIVLVFIFGLDAGRVAPSFQFLAEENTRNLNLLPRFAELRRLVRELLRQRRAKDHDAPDALGFLMKTRHRQSRETLPEASIVNEALTMVVAGHETTASTLNFAWYLLSQNAEADAKLFTSVSWLGEATPLSPAEIEHSSYVRQVIDETMRLYPPGWLITRRAIGADQIGGVNIEASAEVYISPYLIQRHPSFWPDPNAFNPDRFSEGRPPHADHALLPFSAGPRNCIGETLARTEMHIHLAQIARCLKMSYQGAPPLLDAQVNLRTRHDLSMRPQRRPVTGKATFGYREYDNIESH